MIHAQIFAGKLYKVVFAAKFAANFLIFGPFLSQTSALPQILCPFNVRYSMTALKLIKSSMEVRNVLQPCVYGTGPLQSLFSHFSARQVRYQYHK